MPFRYNPKDTEREEYGPDRDRPKDIKYEKLDWNHPLNVAADLARGTRTTHPGTFGDRREPEEYKPI